MSANPAPISPPLRHEIDEAARLLRISRALLYRRIRDGAIRAHKDGARTFISAAELARYVTDRDATAA